jgi:N-acetylglucosamine malate deacetylase 1
MQQIDEAVDISPYMETKLAAVRAYKSQCAVMRFDEAVLGLDRYHGEMHSGWPAARYAEIFSEWKLKEPIRSLKLGGPNGN